MLLLLVILYFNSIKVQLRLDRLKDKVYHHLFQFHKGTIKTLTKINSEKNSAISIP